MSGVVRWPGRRLLRTLAGPAAALLLVACTVGPESVHWGVEECAHCRMVISDERFAGQIVDRRGKTHKFDAIECMAAFLNGGGVATADVHSIWVADGPDAWRPVEATTFLHSPQTRTPMGGGYTAHASAGAAQAAQQEVGGDVLTWQDVRQRVGSGDAAAHRHDSGSAGSH